MNYFASSTKKLDPKNTHLTESNQRLHNSHGILLHLSGDDKGLISIKFFPTVPDPRKNLQFKLKSLSLREFFGILGIIDML